MDEGLIVFSMSLLAVAAVLVGVVVGFWIVRTREHSAAERTRARLEDLGSLAGATSDASGTFAEELLAEKLRLYSRVLQENGRPVEALVAAGAGRNGGGMDDPMAQRDALRAVSEAPVRLRVLLPKVDLIASAEVAGLTRHLYRAWEACLGALGESGVDAPAAGDDASWQEAWPAAHPALRAEFIRWDVEPVYERIRERMRSELGIEPDGAAPSFTPDQLRARVKAFTSFVNRDE